MTNETISPIVNVKKLANSLSNSEICELLQCVGGRLDIGELANNLSNNQICELLNRVGSRIDIFYGLHNMCCLSSDFSSACMNGPTIQINCETADLDDLSEHKFFAYALAKGGGNTEGQNDGCNHENDGTAEIRQ